MAGCYHDKQDFKSDVDIEVAREGDILEYGQDLDEIECEKNPGHRGFIPFKDLTLDHLPTAIRYKETFDCIKKIGTIVVRIVRDGLVGSGYVSKIGFDFRDSQFCIKTNNHVVSMDHDVRRCTVEFHYDSKDRSNVVTSKGVKLVNTCPNRDITTFEFYPIPDFLHRLDWNSYNLYIPCIVIRYKDNQIVGGLTMTAFHQSQSYASPVNINNPFIDLMFISWVDGSISYINSPFFRFKPICSNIQEVTSIDIYIDDDNGKSRVIPGDMVKFGDEFVVKISGSIFQDEVKKCRLVWNGEVIGRGTRLYFEKIKPSKIFCELSGSDSDGRLWNGYDFWLFDCDKAKFIEDQLNTKLPLDMCCIGHPHGSIKMVTFGYRLEKSLERFDNQCRHIDKPGKHCQCSVVSCRNYSCKTCKGSSGSPVFTLVKKPDLISNSTHFMGKRCLGLAPNGENIENINTCWRPTLKIDLKRL